MGSLEVGGGQTGWSARGPAAAGLTLLLEPSKSSEAFALEKDRVFHDDMNSITEREVTG